MIQVVSINNPFGIGNPTVKYLVRHSLLYGWEVSADVPDWMRMTRLTDNLCGYLWMSNQRPVPQTSKGRRALICHVVTENLKTKYDHDN